MMDAHGSLFCIGSDRIEERDEDMTLRALLVRALNNQRCNNILSLKVKKIELEDGNSFKPRSSSILQ